MRRAALLLTLLTLAPIAFARGAGSGAMNVVSADGVAWFTNHNRELWRTDGTAGGTYQVDLRGARTHIYQSASMAAMGGRLYLFATDDDTARLRVTNDSGGTDVVASFEGMAVGHLTASASRLYFLSRSRTSPDCIRLWTSDGTANGTHVIATLFTDEAEPLGTTANAMLFRLYTGPFEYDGRTRYDLWSTSGTAEGTALVDETAPVTLTAAAGVLFYLRGNELGRTDGTKEGTFSVARRVTEIVTAGADALIFRKEQEYWRTDGTIAGTSAVGTIRNFTPHSYNGTHLIGETRDQKNTLTIQSTTDGKTREALAIINLRTNQWRHTIYSHVTIGRFVYVFAGATTRDELWRTDGTLAGTELLRVFPLDPLAGLSGPELHVVGDRLLFWAYDPALGYEPWISDGTREGTRMVANLAREGTLRGRVTDALTGAPVTDAVVEIQIRHSGGMMVEATLPVDGNGAYEYVGAGDVFVYVRTSGEHIAHKPATSVRIPNDQTVTVDVALQRGGRIAGRVTDVHGKPLAGVSVNFLSALFGPLFPFMTVTTDADGYYATSGLPTDQSWLVYTSDHPGYSASMHGGVSCAPGCENVVRPPRLTLAAGEVRTVDFALAPSGKFSFRVLDTTTGQPVAVPVTVRAYREGERFPKIEAVVTFRGGEPNEITLPDGRYWLFVSDSNGLYGGMWYPAVPCGQDCSGGPRGTPIAPTPGETRTITFELTPRGGRIAGRVVDARTGEGLRGIRVEIIEGSGLFGTVAITDATGAYATTAPLRAGVPYWIRTTTVSTYLPELYDGADGIICRLPCRIEPGAVPVTLGEREVRTGVDFRLDRGGSIAGMVVDSVTGAPVPTFTAYVNSEGHVATVTTGPGTFTAVGLYPGTYYVNVNPFEPWRIPPRETVTVELGVETTITIAVQPGCLMKFSPTEVTLPAAGGGGTVAYTHDCPSLPHFGTITSWFSYSLPAAGELSYLVQPNHGPARAHQFVGPGAVLTIRQEAGW